MASLRTAEHVAEDYGLARAAYHRALQAESTLRTDDGQTRQVMRAKTQELKKQMDALEREYGERTGSGMVLLGVIPLG